ncbi:MAG: oligosaccharide flippase family protein [Bacteroidales bacterium]|nr:oligosaccharide flippase family protein [Bacteroidales bacterium]
MHSEFLRSVFTLISGTAIAQAIPILISPILTRLYSPNDFGVWAIYISIVAIFGVIISLRYEMAIILPKEEKDAVNVLALSILISIFISFISLIFIIFFKNIIFKLIGNTSLGNWLYLVPPTLFFTGLYQSFNYYSTRQKTFRKNASARIAQSAVASGINLGAKLGYLTQTLKLGAGGLISGSFLGLITASLILALKTIKNFGSFARQISKTSLKGNLIRYKNFARINSPHAFIDSFQDNGIILIITYYFSSYILGFYSFAFRILKAPVGLIGNAMYQVFYQKAASSMNENKDLRPLLLRIYRNLFLGGLPLFLILFLFAPDIFAFIFSEKWRTAGEIASIITPWLFINFIISPVSCIPLIVNRQFGAMLFTITDICLRIIALVTGAYLNDYKLSFTLMSISCSLLLIYAMYWYYKIAGKVNAKVYQ